MRKLSALLLALVLAMGIGTAYAAPTFDWDVTARVTKWDDATLNSVHPGSIPTGYWLYEYAWFLNNNDAATTPDDIRVVVGGCPSVLFNYGIWDSEAPDSGLSGGDYPDLPGFDELPQYSGDWLGTLVGPGVTTYTGGHWIERGSGDVNTGTGNTVAATAGKLAADWQYGSTSSANNKTPGLALYTSYLANRPAVPQPWSIDNDEDDWGTTLGPTPEPVSAVLLLLGLPAAAALRKRRE